LMEFDSMEFDSIDEIEMRKKTLARARKKI
jgi:hypothetical protein